MDKVPISVRSDNFPLRVGLGWVMLESFLIWVTLPVKMPVAALYSGSIGICHTVLVAWKGSKQPMLVNQVNNAEKSNANYYLANF